MKVFSFKYDISVKGRPLCTDMKGLQDKVLSTKSNMWNMGAIYCYLSFLKNGHISTCMFDCVCASPSLGQCTEHAVGRGGGGGRGGGWQEGASQGWVGS